MDGAGLQTGDASLNVDAPVVVMTTEILRNMLYRVDEEEGRVTAQDRLKVCVEVSRGLGCCGQRGMYGLPGA